MKISVVSRRFGEVAVKVVCAVGDRFRCDDDTCDHDDYLSTKLHALNDRAGYITMEDIPHYGTFVLFEIADPVQKSSAEDYFHHKDLEPSAKWRNGIEESVSNGGLFWFR